MIYDDDTYYRLLKELDSLKFLLGVSTELDRLVKRYHVIGTPLVVEISRNFFTTSRYEIEKIYYDVNKKEWDDYNFEEFFDLLPEDAKENVMFNLDLFR